MICRWAGVKSVSGPIWVCCKINFSPSTVILSEFASVFLPSINKWPKMSAICRHQLSFCQSLYPFSCHQSINGRKCPQSVTINELMTKKCPQSVAINELMTENVRRPPSSMNLHSDFSAFDRVFGF
jgi:hypothetical protein